MEARETAFSSNCPRCGHQPDQPRPQSAASLSGTDESVRDFLLRIYCRVMIVLILYVLSTGPMYWAIYEAFNTNGSSFLAKLYFPLVLACQYSDPICTWFDWYLGLWVY